MKVTDKSIIKPTVVTIGEFDALHTGHIKLIEKTVEKAKEKGALSCIFTFDGKIKNIKSAKSFQDEDERLKLIENMKIDVVFICKFNDAFKELTPEEFVSDYLIKKLNCTEVVVGKNFRFGKNAGGDTKTLESICNYNGIKCTIIDEVKTDLGEIVSSTMLRNLAQNGEIERFNKYLSRPFKIKGIVRHGRKVGRSIGFPTINFKLNSSLLTPQNGVYISEVKFENHLLRAVTNIGNAPTFNQEENLAETFIINFEKDLYGKNIEVYLYKKLRDIKKFQTKQQLINQIEEDIIAAKEYTTKD